MAMTVMYNGVQFAPVSARQSMVLPHSADVLWSVVGKFGRQALWMGTVEGQPIYSQLLGGETVDYLGAVRVFGIGDKALFEQLTKMDNQNRSMAWQLTTHPMNSNPFPAAFVNCTASIQVLPVTLPSNQAFMEWRIDLLTEQHHVPQMTKAIDDIMIVGLTNLVKYMEKSTGSSGGSLSGLVGVVGSLVAPSAIGAQHMPQPSADVQPQRRMSQAESLTGDSTFLQQPTFVPAPGESLPGSATSTAPQAAHQQQLGSQQLYGQLQHQGQEQRQQQEQLQQFQENQMWVRQQQWQQQQGYAFQQAPMNQQQLQQQLQQQAYQQALQHSNSGNSASSETQRHVQQAVSHGPHRAPSQSQGASEPQQAFSQASSAKSLKSAGQETAQHPQQHSH